VSRGLFSVPSRCNRRFHAGDLPSVHGLAVILVGLRQQEVPGRAQRVDLELVVLVVVTVRIDEDSKSLSRKITESCSVSVAQR
jgi:hypothetical protein